MRDADKVMEDAKHREVPSIDDVLVAPTVVARQLYELVADETGLEECRGVVGRALDRGRIGGDVWAKVSFVLLKWWNMMAGWGRWGQYKSGCN